MSITEMDIVTNINAGKTSQAQAGINSLIANFSGHPDLPKAIYYIGRKYRWTKQYEEARNYYQQIIQQYPDSSYAAKAQRDIAEVNILLDITAGKISEARTGVNSLIAGSSTNSDFARTLYYIGRRYGSTENYEDARGIFQQVIQLYPGSPYARKAQMSITKIDNLSLIASRNDGGVMAAVDSLVASYSGDSEVSIAVCQIANKYYEQALKAEIEGLAALAKDYSQKAETLWERVINELPVSDMTPEAHCNRADYYSKLGQYEKSINCYQKVVDDYPNSQYAWNALYMVGFTYERFQETGRISKLEAEPKVKAAYEQLLEEYPTCPRTKQAGNWLNLHNSN